MTAFMHPGDMTPEERRAEIVSILACGYLRSRVDNSSVNREEPLDAVADKSVYAPATTEQK
jgi:hypothetical protein